MKLLFENWRRYLNEGRELEQYTTLISREIVNALKDPDLRDAFTRAKQIMFRMDIDEVVENLAYVRDVYVNIMEGTGVLVHAKYEFDMDATEEQRRNSDITVDIALPLDYDNSIFSELIPDLKEVLRHELEHSDQPTEMLMKDLLPGPEIWKSLESAENYFTGEAETKAHVVGIYKKAKTLKEPAGSILDDEIMNIYGTGVKYGHDDDEVFALANKIRDYWRYYMQSRFPHAEIDWEQ